MAQSGTHPRPATSPRCAVLAHPCPPAGLASGARAASDVPAVRPQVELEQELVAEWRKFLDPGSSSHGP
jgi:hypothetical protein